MPRQGRHNEETRLRPVRLMLEGALEMQQAAERALPHGFDMHRHPGAAHEGGFDAPFGAAVAPRGSLEHLAGRRHRLAESRHRERVKRILEQQLGGIGQGARRVKRRMTHFIKPVHRRGEQDSALVRQLGRTAEFADSHFGYPFYAALQQTWGLVAFTSIYGAAI